MIDTAFVDPLILPDAVAHMLRSMQEDNPQKEVTVHVKWRKLARHAITTVDGEPAQLPSPTPQPEPSTSGTALRKFFR